MADEVRLKVNGKSYDGWKSLRVTQSLKAIAAGFQLEVTNTWAERKTPWPIRKGDACGLWFGKDQVIDGFVDETHPSLKKDSNAFSVSGRDKTADLVDCSSEHLGEWQNVNLRDIAENIARPFGVKVKADVDVGARWPVFRPTPTDSAFECLDRAARLRGILVTAGPAGSILLTRPSKVKAGVHLIEGDNIIAADRLSSMKEQHSSYTVLSELGNIEDGDNAALSLQLKAAAKDPQVKRHRPLVMKAETSSDRATLQDRANWEANNRRAKGERASVSIESFRRPSGRLWKLNELVLVTSPYLELKREELLIADIVFLLDGPEGQGEMTALTLEPPDAYTVLVPNEKESLKNLADRERRR